MVNNILRNMDVEEYSSELIPIVEIKDEDDSDAPPQKMTLLPRRVTEEDKIKDWDSKLTKKCKTNMVIDTKTKDFEYLLEEYIKFLEKDAVLFKKKSFLKNKILFHLSFFHIMFCCLLKKLVGICTITYLDLIERVLLIYCNLELQSVHNWKVNQQAGSEHAIAKRVAQKLINTICVNLMNDQKRIFHTLLKLNHEHELNCKEIMNIVYKHVLISHPVKDSSDLSYCRYYLLFEKWKSFNAKKDHEAIDKIFTFIFKRTPESIEKTAVFKEIWGPTSNSIVNVVDALLNGPQTFIRKYFNYIGKMCSGEEDIGDTNHTARSSVDDAEVSEDSAELFVIDGDSKEKTSEGLIKKENETAFSATATITLPAAPVKRQQYVEVASNSGEVVCVIDDDDDDSDVELIIETDNMANNQQSRNRMRLSFIDPSPPTMSIIPTVDEVIISRSPSPSALLLSNEVEVLPVLSNFIETIQKGVAEDSSVIETPTPTDSFIGLEESFERTSLEDVNTTVSVNAMDTSGEDVSVNETDKDGAQKDAAVENVSEKEAQNDTTVDNNESSPPLSQINSDNNTSVEMHVDGTSSTDNHCAYCNRSRTAKDPNSNDNEVVVSTTEPNKISVDYFCGMDTPPSSDRTADENTNMEIINGNDNNIESSNMKVYSYVPNITSQEFHIETDHTTPENKESSQNMNEQRISNNTVEQQESPPLVENQEQTITETIINTEIDEIDQTLIEDSERSAIENQEAPDTTIESINHSETDETQQLEDIARSLDDDFDLDDSHVEDVEIEVEETPLDVFEKSVNESELSLEKSIDTSEKSFNNDINLDETALSIEEQPLYTKSTAKQIIEMVNEIGLQEEEEVPVTEVSVIVNSTGNELNQQTAEFQPCIFMTDANTSFEIINPVTQSCALSDNTIATTHVNDPNEEYQIINSVRESIAALTQSDYCLNSISNVATTSTALSSVPLVVTKATPNLEITSNVKLMPLLLNPNLVAEGQDMVFPNMSTKMQSPSKGTLTSAAPANIHTNKYIYTSMNPHLNTTSVTSMINPVMNNGLNEFEVSHQQKHTPLHTTNVTPSCKIQASVTMQPLVDTMVKIKPLSKTTNGKLKSRRNSMSQDKIAHVGDKGVCYSHDCFDKFMQSQREFMENTLSGPVDTLNSNKKDYSSYDDIGVNDFCFEPDRPLTAAASTYKYNLPQQVRSNVQSNSAIDRASPVSPAYEHIQAGDYKSHILKVNLENSGMKPGSILKKKSSKTSPPTQLYIEQENSGFMQNVNGSGSELMTPYKSAITSSSKIGTKRKRSSNELNKKPKVTFNTHVETYKLPSEEEYLRTPIQPLITTDYNNLSKSSMATSKKRTVNSSGSDRTRTVSYPANISESVNKPKNIINKESMDEYKVSYSDRRLFSDTPCVEVKLDSLPEINQRINQLMLKSKVDIAMKRKKLESENTCIQTRIDFIKPTDEPANALLNRHMENMTAAYPSYGYVYPPETNFLGYPAGALSAGYTNPSSVLPSVKAPGEKRKQHSNESTEDNRNNNTDSRLSVKARRLTVSEEKGEVNVVNSQSSKKPRRRNNASKSPAKPEATKRKAGRPRKTETAKSPKTKTSTEVTYSDGPFRLG